MRNRDPTSGIFLIHFSRTALLKESCGMAIFDKDLLLVPSEIGTDIEIAKI